ncbi:hypothetical protein F5Y19DRAFT_399759 [Xylariaceae sp. FL1651]|nr:hypothetical protein F5Y19DRAFT_399759 [Xylariaceae sp. FL1651]
MAPRPPAVSPPPEAATASPTIDGGVARRKPRKASGEYSTNPNTMRVRARNARLTPYQRGVEAAKANDLKAVSLAWKERIDTETYQMSSESRRKLILEEVEKKVMERRRQKKIDADSKIHALNQAMCPNDANPAPRTGIIPRAAQPVPHMAPPGYIHFPAQPIPELMKVNKPPLFDPNRQLRADPSANPIGDNERVEPHPSSLTNAMDGNRDTATRSPLSNTRDDPNVSAAHDTRDVEVAKLRDELQAIHAKLDALLQAQLNTPRRKAQTAISDKHNADVEESGYTADEEDDRIDP